MSGAVDSPAVAIVTGAGRGIGRAVAARFARHGYRTLLTDIDARELEVAARALADEGLDIATHAEELSDPAAPKRIVDAARNRWGQIDALVNNAAFHGSRQSVLNTPMAEWEQVFRVNVFAAAALSREAAMPMARQGGGAIVNIGSVQFDLPALSYAAYVSSKGAVVAMTRALAAELGNLNIRVNGVAPGVIASEAYRDSLERLAGSDAPPLASLLGRAGTPEEVANAVLFLAGKDASFITGAMLAVDGGRAHSRRQDPFQAEFEHDLSQEDQDG